MTAINDRDPGSHRKKMQPSVYYLAPDFDSPSWGVGLLYKHVEILRSQGVDAFVLHDKVGFSINWLETVVPVAFLEDPSFEVRPGDMLVVPEVLAEKGRSIGGDCRRMVFVQGSYLILQPFSEAISYRDLGYEAAITILPHVKEILERHFDIEASIVPPFVAPYFFLEDSGSKGHGRQKRILMFPKQGYREAGFFDYDILRKILERGCRRNPPWELLEVTGRPHREVATLMQESELMVSVNCLEAFNTTVPESMAAGCLPICYEGFGGQDFLVDQKNAFVFQNNYVYMLADTAEKLMNEFERRGDEMTELRRQAQVTARTFSRGNTEKALADLFRDLGFCAEAR